MGRDWLWVFMEPSPPPAFLPFLSGWVPPKGFLNSMGTRGRAGSPPFGYTGHSPLGLQCSTWRPELRD